MSNAKTILSPDTKQLLMKIAQLYFIVSLLVPMLVPAGMMLTRNSESNIVELSICSATNPRIVFFDLNTGALVKPDPYLTSTEPVPAVVGTGEHPVSDTDLCPFDLATTDHLSITALAHDATAPPAGESPRQTIVSGFRQTKHPSLPPRGPPQVS